MGNELIDYILDRIAPSAAAVNVGIMTHELVVCLRHHHLALEDRRRFLCECRQLRVDYASDRIGINFQQDESLFFELAIVHSSVHLKDDARHQLACDLSPKEARRKLLAE